MRLYLPEINARAWVETDQIIALHEIAECYDSDLRQTFPRRWNLVLKGSRWQSGPCMTLTSVQGDRLHNWLLDNTPQADYDKATSK